MTQNVPIYKGWGNNAKVIGYTLVSDHWFEYLNQWRWHLEGSGYVCRDEQYQRILMHRVVANTPVGMETDHINQNKLDNRAENLRICSQENRFNYKLNKRNQSGYKGVSWNKWEQRWVSQIQAELQEYHLGSFDTSKEAAIAHDYAARRLHGEFASLNFPDTPEVPNPILDAILSGNRPAQRRINRNNKSGYIGVRWNKNAKKYSSGTTYMYHTIHIGYYDTAEQAARARDRKEIELRGDKAVLNFPREDYE